MSLLLPCISVSVSVSVFVCVDVGVGVGVSVWTQEKKNKKAEFWLFRDENDEMLMRCMERED